MWNLFVLFVSLVCFFLFGHRFTGTSLLHGAVGERRTAACAVAQFGEPGQVLDAAGRAARAHLVTGGSSGSDGPAGTGFEACSFRGAQRPSGAGSVAGGFGSSGRAAPFARPARGLFLFGVLRLVIVLDAHGLGVGVAMVLLLPLAGQRFEGVLAGGQWGQGHLPRRGDGRVELAGLRGAQVKVGGQVAAVLR